MKHTRWNTVVRCLVVLSLASMFSTAALARDAKRAQGYLDSIPERIKVQDWYGAENYLKMAEEQIAKTSGAERDALTKKLDQARKDVQAAHDAADKERVVSRIQSQLDQSKEYLDDMRKIEQCEDVMETLLKVQENQHLLTDAERAGYRKQFEALKQQARQHEAAKHMGEAKQLVDEAEKEVGAAMKQIQKPDSDYELRRAFEGGQIHVEKVERALKDLPQDSADVKSMRERMAKLSAQFDAATLAYQTKDFAERITKHWDELKKEAVGWEQENQTPTFATWGNGGLQAPKTEQMLHRADQWLDFVKDSQDIPDAVRKSAPVTAKVDEVRKLREAAVGKLERNAEAVVADAEKLTKLDNLQTTYLSSMSTGFEHTLGGSPKAKALQERASGIVKNYEAKVAAHEAELKALEEKMTQAATAAWPAISKSIQADEISDANALKKGQLVRVTGWENRMRWDYGSSGSGYDWGITFNGRPIVGHFAPHVRSAFDAAMEQTGVAAVTIGRMDVIAEVVGPGTVEKRINHEIRDSGGSTIARGEEWKPVDCIVVKIIAMRGGPVAVGPNGAATLDGKIAPVAAAGMTVSGAASGGGVGWFWRSLTLIIGLSAATAALLKAGYAPVAASAQGQQITARLGNDNLAYVGLACAALGVVWLARGMVLWGLLVSSSIIAAGLYAALDMLLARGLVSTHVADRVKPLGVKIGLACATIVVLHLLVGGRLVVL
jgi:hypothetical protein